MRSWNDWRRSLGWSPGRFWDLILDQPQLLKIFKNEISLQHQTLARLRTPVVSSLLIPAWEEQSCPAFSEWKGTECSNPSSKLANCSVPLASFVCHSHTGAVFLGTLFLNWTHVALYYQFGVELTEYCPQAGNKRSSDMFRWCCSNWTLAEIASKYSIVCRVCHHLPTML